MIETMRDRAMHLANERYDEGNHEEDGFYYHEGRESAFNDILLRLGSETREVPSDKNKANSI